MSLKPGNGTLGPQRFRSHRWCNLYAIERRDGVVIRLTDANDVVEFEAQSYTPVGSGSMTAESRQAQKESEMELAGVLTSTAIKADDIRSGKFRGAMLRRYVVDWVWPWREYFRALYHLVEPESSGGVWKARLLGLAHKLTAPCGRVYGVDCEYVLGDPDTCRADLTGKQVDNVVVTAVVTQRLEFDASALSSTFADAYFQDGAVVWRTGANAETTQVVGSYVQTNRRIKLYLPSPKNIAVNDTFFLRPGCDGTFATCKGKFGNGDNFGGAIHTPGADALLRKP